MATAYADPHLRLYALAKAESRFACESSLYEFIRQGWHVLEPHTPFDPHRGFRAICEVLEAVSRGELRRVKINMPPRQGKTKTVSEFWPAWEWVRQPWLRYLCSSYSAELSTDASVHRRSIIQSRWFQERWGDRFALRGDQNVKTHFENDRAGVMQSTSTGGTVTGKGGDRVIIDDPTKVQDAKQQENLPAALKLDIEFYRETLANRLDNQLKGAIVLVMHRLHPNDLCGHLDKNEPGRWFTLCLRGEGETDESIELPTCANGRSKVIFTRGAGEVLDPERFPKPVLDAMRLTMGPYAYAAQVQQRPSPLEGGLFRRAWWVITSKSDWPVSFEQKWQGWDCAYKKGRLNDFNSCLSVARKGADFYIGRLFNRKLEWPELRRAALDEFAAYQPGLVLIEDAASGISLAQDLSTLPGLPIKAVPVDSDKVARATATTGIVEAGRVHLPEWEPWTAWFIDLMADFPNVEHDDVVDAWSVVFTHIRKFEMANYFMDWMEGQLTEQARKEMEEQLKPKG